MKNLNIKAITFLLCILAIASCKQEKKEEVKLRLKLTAGKKYNYKIITYQDIEQTIQGQKMDIKQVIGMNYIFDVQKVDKNGNATVKVTYKSLSLSQHGAGSDIEYNSEKPGTDIPLAAQTFHNMAGKSFMMQVTPEGEIKNVQGIDKMLDDLFAGKEYANNEEITELRKSMKEQFGERSIAQNMNNMLNIFPDDAVEVGESWQRTLSMSSGFPVILENNYTLKEIKDQLAVVELKSEIKPNEKAKEMEMGGAKVLYNLSGNQNGTLKINKNSGLISTAEIKQELSGDAKLQAGPGMNLGWPLTVKSVTKIESSELK
jgi:hypothetical protein